jgi:hypothetical protein
MKGIIADRAATTEAAEITVAEAAGVSSSSVRATAATTIGVKSRSGLLPAKPQQRHLPK